MSQSAWLNQGNTNLLIFHETTLTFIKKWLHVNFSYLNSNENFYNHSQGHSQNYLSIKVCNFFEQATCLTKFHKNPDLHDYAHKCTPTCTHTAIHKEETSVISYKSETKIIYFSSIQLLIETKLNFIAQLWTQMD